ncbi:hypothetical protein ASPVEDRAFT_81262 [Aspergillus versicolor CBS 583.65]|uniref:Zn(2)-C6 fungal-type domain-containing protein n=1 Tax=Aspergillus versicolor CBS 583.65 TaxID=1036611 RepID=A0A1L9PDR7_ASPVE|nr:uncharacterized protein ASPVEDRAFT_81262 [Aspergillus versicolor CBS 583.65]OJI99667.1 hypothetical protein ASPVEDRAFT_81262 [Aspergillus versicolor CBS 583.65]
MPSPIEVGKKRRTSAPKNRTGCGTCKRRHKRCDETRPICDLCRKSGYVCDGYFDPSTGKSFGGNSQHMRHVSQRLHPVPLNHFDNEQEAQGFRFFEIATTLQLAAALENLGWTPPLLQLSHHDRAIRHAIIANGIMSKRYQENQLLANANSQTDELYREALGQYGKAVACFRSQLQDSQESSRQSLENLPAMCVLLVMFEFMQGNAEGLLLHLQSAIKLASRARNGPQAQNFHKLLTLIDMVASTWINLYRSHSHTTLQLPKITASQMPLPMPSDLITLSYDLINIKNDLMTLRHFVASAPGAASIQILDPSNLFEANLEGIQCRLEAWISAFIRLSATDAKSCIYRCSLLRANYLLAILELDAIRKVQPAWGSYCVDSSEKSDSLKAKMKTCSEIVDLVEEVTRKGYTPMRYDVCAGEESLAPTGLVPLFSFRLSFIQPVFYVAQNAPDIGLRRKSVRILLQNPWREGAWHSLVMGSIAERCLEHQSKGSGISAKLKYRLCRKESGIRVAVCP